MTPIVGMVVFGVGFVVCVVWYLWPLPEKDLTPIANKETPGKTAEVEHSQTSERNPNPLTASIKNLTNAQLKERTTAFAAQMRVFDVRRSQAVENLFILQPITREMSQEEKNSIWQKNNMELQKLIADTQIEFMNRFRPEALALKDELLFRLRMQGFQPPPPLKLAESTISDGTLAGIHPISDAANWIESMARLLEAA